MYLDLHFANGSKVSKATLARHLAHEHGFIYPPVTQLAKWKKEELVLAHEDAHVAFEAQA